MSGLNHGRPATRVRKRFGQHFLHDPAVIRKIVSAISPGADQHVVEIGPGLGAITSELIATNAQLTLIEIDRDLIAELHVRFPEVSILEADALKVDFEAFSGQGKVRIVGNLPYNISTPLLFHLYGQLPFIEDMVFMLQEEVVDRICASPGTSTYGRLSVMSQFHCNPEKLFSVGPGAFHPPPKVTSAIIRLVPREPLPGIDLKCLESVVRTAFSARRKTLKNALRGLLNATELLAIDIDPGVRPEQLSLADFCRCAVALSSAAGPT